MATNPPIPTKRLRGQETIKQIEHHDNAGAQSTTMPVFAPGVILTTTMNASPGVAVGKGNLIRVKVAAQTFVQFSDDAITSAPDSSTPDAIEIDTIHR